LPESKIMTGAGLVRWYLVQTKSREELRAIENLERQGVSSFCPLISVEKISRAKRVVVDEVLFPGYLFVNFDHEKISAATIRSTRGVLQFVRCAGSPINVPESLIEGLKKRVICSSDEVMSELPNAGDRLEILEGPFRGLEAIFSQPDGNSRAIVLISLLNQKVKATLPLTSFNKRD
jgi:transcriptional antiterminator RfaH